MSPAKSHLPSIKPLAQKERVGYVFLERCRVDVDDSAFVMIRADETRVQIPVGSISTIFLEPGTRVSHGAVVLAARSGTLLIWVGEAGVRTYAAGQPGGARADRLLYQARLALEETLRLRVVRKMFELRFKEPAPVKRSVNQLRGIEGARVRRLYGLLARRHGVDWKARRYDSSEWTSGDVPNRCVSAATACLYGVCEAAILAAGYAPAIGFIHTGKPQSFVYDIGDIFKFETVVPIAFEVASRNPADPEMAVRHACRESFRSTRLLGRIIPTIQEILAAGRITPPEPSEDQVGPAFPEPEDIGDGGHRL
ncbi:MAG: type I-E CRISPR-associated endonuclease Cas1e [Myxococcota bacterium]